MPDLTIVVSCAAVLLPAISSSSDSLTSGNAKIQEIEKAVVEAPANKLSRIQRDGAILIAQKYGGSDPHGKDPHDENHDARLPANKESLPANKHRYDHVAPDDVYGYKYPNGQQPY